MIEEYLKLSTNDNCLAEGVVMVESSIVPDGAVDLEAVFPQ
jgi:hypothetical protein